MFLFLVLCADVAGDRSFSLVQDVCGLWNLKTCCNCECMGLLLMQLGWGGFWSLNSKSVWEAAFMISINIHEELVQILVNNTII
jgi:hypothetical protein